MNKKVSLVLRWVFLIVVLVALYAPIALIVVYSFSSEKNIGSANGFGQFTFSLYSSLFSNRQIMSATLNTLIIGLVSATLATAVGTLTAVGLHYMKRGKKTVNFVSQITVVNAEIVTAVGFFLLSIFLRDVLKLPVQKGVGWLILAHTVMTTPYVILTVSPRLSQLNPNLYEAGLDLGASPTKALFSVIMPEILPGIFSGFMLAITLSLDDYIVSTFTRPPTFDTISTYVFDAYAKGGKGSSVPALRALSTIIFVVMLIVLLVQNILAGKKKGGNK